MNRLLSLSAIVALLLLLDSCALARRTLQVPGRMIQAVGRTMTTSVESPEAEGAHVAIRATTPAVR